MWHQQIVTLSAKPRGFHLVTDELLGPIREIASCNAGLLHLLLQHTSASLTLNENCAVPEDAPYEHDYEGPDDMPAHIKSSLLGASLTLPVQKGRVLLGTWQGIWLGEHRIRGGARRIVATLQGE